MGLKYCTFWYQTIYHQELHRLCDSGISLETDISDEGQSSYKLNVRLEALGNIKIVSTLGDTKPYTILLKRGACSETGFVQYAFDIESIDGEYRKKFETVLCKDVYHLANSSIMNMKRMKEKMEH